MLTFTFFYFTTSLGDLTELSTFSFLSAQHCSLLIFFSDNAVSLIYSSFSLSSCSTQRMVICVPFFHESFMHLVEYRKWLCGRLWSLFAKLSLPLNFHTCISNYFMKSDTQRGQLCPLYTSTYLRTIHLLSWAWSTSFSLTNDLCLEAQMLHSPAFSRIKIQWKEYWMETLWTYPMSATCIV